MVRVGFGERDITPPPGTAFGGFALERLKPAEGAHDRLMAVAVALAGADGEGIVVACDLQLVTADLVQAAREEIEAAVGVPQTAVMIHATHDHAAPGGDASETGIAGADLEFGPFELTARVLDGIVGAAIEAHEQLTNARLRLHAGEIPGIARRRHDPASPQAAPARLLIARQPDGAPVGAIVHYACHPSVLGPENRLFTADYPGIVRNAISAELAGAPVCFLNGPAGDLSTRHVRRETSFAELARLGGALADQIWRLTEHSGRALRGDRFSSLVRTIELPLAPLPSTLELAHRLEAAEREALAAGEPSDASSRVRRARFAAERAGRLRNLASRVPVELQALRLGELRLLGIAGEPFSELGAAIEAAARAPLLVVAPANGSVGNIAPAALAAQSGGILAPGAGELLVQAAGELLREVEAVPPDIRP